MAKLREPQYFFKTVEDKVTCRRLRVLLEFNRIDKEVYDGMINLWFEGKELDKQLVTAFIDARLE